MNKLFLCFASLLLSVTVYGQVSRYSQVTIHSGARPLSDIAALGIPLDEAVSARNGNITMILSQDELAKLARAGFTWDVNIEDYSASISERNSKLTGTIEKINRDIKDGMIVAGNYPIPAGFELGTMGGFYKLEEAYSEMDSLHNLYPGIVSAKEQFNGGTTLEGRPIYYVKISDNPNMSENEPRVFYNGLTHAREPIGMQQLFYFMNYICEHYASDPEIQYLVDNTEMYFVPVMNPDGYYYNQQTNPYGGGLWRKNRRNNGDGTYGVDLNRNWGYMWGYDNVGSSPYTYDETYRGTAAFSEPETQVQREFCDDRDFKLALNNHSHANLFLYPWSYVTEDTPDSTVFRTFSTLMTRENNYPFGTPGALLYNTNGDINDWLYGDITLHPAVFSFTPEIGNNSDDFWPPPSRIVPLSQESMLMDLLIAHLSYRYAEVTDESDVIIGERQGFFHYEIERYGLDNNGEYTVSIQPLDNTVITAVGDPKTFTGMDQFEIRDDSVSFTLSPDLEIGTPFKFLLQVNNGFYTHSDTITKYFGPPMVVFMDSCGDFSKWTSNKWNKTNAKFWSPPSSITDSPSGNYANNENNSATMTEPADLHDSPVAVIEYRARWNIEKGFDYLQVKASAGLGYTPLAGKYTHPGGANQPAGQPVYDGVRNDWVKEQIVTTAYENKDITLRYTLTSDYWTTADGFYFDDLSVTVIDMSGVGIGQAEKEGRAFLSEPTPNPASGKATFRYALPAGHEGLAYFRVYDLRGREIYSSQVETRSGVITLNTSDFGPGVLLCRLEAAGMAGQARKLIVIK